MRLARIEAQRQEAAELADQMSSELETARAQIAQQAQATQAGGSPGSPASRCAGGSGGGAEEEKLANPAANFPTIKDIITVDGVRVIFENGWGLIRASNTTPKN